MESAAGEKKHFVLVHGACHGAWCWYKVATLLAAAGHRVTTPDLAASGVDPRRLNEVGSFSEHWWPLMEVMSALPPGERVVLVGHSFGGMSISHAVEKFPEKVTAAVFVTAFLPDTSSSRSYVLDEYAKKFSALWLENKMLSLDRGPKKPLAAFTLTPKFVSSKLYQLCPPEDITLALSLLRVGSLFQEDLCGEPPFSEASYGSAKKVYIVCDEDLTLPREYQLWMTENYAVEEVKVVEAADHMAMMSKPQELCQHLLDVAHKYA